MSEINAKNKVREFWDADSCGEKLLLDGLSQDDFKNHANRRYALEPYIFDFAKFGDWKDKKVLEIGLGLGADHEKFAEGGAILYGIDLTERAVNLTKLRFDKAELNSNIQVGDAEKLPYQSNFFDLVYSWGVIHHTPNTLKAAQEILRVLKPGGVFKVMVYHKWSMVGIMLWIRYALLTGRFWLGLEHIYGKYLESHGTKAYTKAESIMMFDSAVDVKVQIQISHGDLLSSGAGQRHLGVFLAVARKIWPRSFLRKYAKGFGLYLLISGIKKI